MVRILEHREIADFLDKELKQFYNHKIDFLKKITLSDILSEYNPYLSSIRNCDLAGTFINDRLDDFLFVLEEDLLNDLLVNLAIFICGRVYKGKKSAAEGIDLEVTKDGIIYIVTIKSGPKWGNRDQIEKMKANFRKAIKILKTNNPKIHVIAVNGCCYGRDNKPEKGEYQKLCGQRFWGFISDNEDLYTEIIEPLGHRAKEENEKFSTLYPKVINKFSLEFMNEFCFEGEIQWSKLVQFNSGIESIRFKRQKITKG